jgi:hypothetical protein
VDIRQHDAMEFRSALCFLFCVLLMASCQPQEDPRIAQLEKDVARLSDENNRLVEQIRSMEKQLAEEPAPQAVPVPEPEAPSFPEMTVDTMKAEIQPLLKDLVEKLKTSEARTAGSGFRMRTEYDMKGAIYGLVRNEDPAVPYWAKVIVRYEKFVESDSYSRSFGRGSLQFLFAFANNRWVLMNDQKQ